MIGNAIDTIRLGIKGIVVLGRKLRYEKRN